MKQTLSPAWAIATILEQADLVDFRPADPLGDTFLEHWPESEVGDEVVQIQTMTGTTEYGVEGFESLIRITVRSEDGKPWDTRNKVNRIYDALLRFPCPSAVEAAMDDEGEPAFLTVAGLWPAPGVVSRKDEHDRFEFVLYVRVSHGDLVV